MKPLKALTDEMMLELAITLDPGDFEDINDPTVRWFLPVNIGTIEYKEDIYDLIHVNNVFYVMVKVDKMPDGTTKEVLHFETLATYMYVRPPGGYDAARRFFSRLNENEDIDLTLDIMYDKYHRTVTSLHFEEDGNKYIATS